MCADIIQNNIIQHELGTGRNEQTLYFTHQHRQGSTHLVQADGAEGFLRRVRGQGKRVDFGQTRLYIKLLGSRAHIHRPAMQDTGGGDIKDQM